MYSVQNGPGYAQQQMFQWQNAYTQLQNEMAADWNARQDHYVNQAFQTLHQSQYQSNQAMYQYLNGGGHPGPGPGHGIWECIARDAGWEEHRGGHYVQGRGYQQTYRRAEMACRQAGHGSCHIRCNQIGRM